MTDTSEKKLSGPHLYAFWRYDTFPYLLGDEGTLQPDGRFKCFGYGGMIVSRSRIVGLYPVELGRSKMTQIKVIGDRYREEVRAIEEALQHDLCDILIELKDKK